MIGFLKGRRAKWLLAGSALFVLFLVVNLPAAWLGLALERASKGAVVLGDAQGTVWRGRGAFARRAAGGYRYLAGVEWRLAPAALLGGKLGLALSGETPEGRWRANVDLGFGGITLKDVEADIAAAAFEQAIPILAMAKPDGRVKLQASHLEAGKGMVRGAATLEWIEGGLPGLHTTRLGDYRLQITGNGDRADLRLATLRGDLRLNGQGEWRASQPETVQLRGVAQIPPDRQDLEALLPLIGARGAGNSRTFTWNVPTGRLF